MTSRAARLLVLGLIAAVPAALAGSRAAARQDDADLLRTGRMLYESSCASCHGPEALGSAQGPSLAGAGAAAVDFQLSTGRMPLSTPDQQARRKPPAFSPEQIRAIVAYVTSIVEGGPDIPQVFTELGDVSRGREIFSANCLACHGAAAQGGAIGGGALAPSLHPASPVEVAEAVRIGPGTMPPFGHEVISDLELNSLVRYVRSLREPESPGGAGLGWIGPVAEGFVAWLLGLGLLLAIIRYLGTTRAGS